MKMAKYVTYTVFFCSLFFLAPSAHAFGETNRYLVKSSSSLARKAVGSIRHDFGVSFSADLSPFQIRIARMFGDVERVGQLAISEQDAPAMHTPYDAFLTLDESDVSVAVLDTGYGADDSNGHGTHIADIIASKGNAHLVIYRVCNERGYCFSDDVAAAIRAAADVNVQIINMSFGSDQHSPLIAGAIKYAVDREVLLVAAAGNNGPFEDSVEYPARDPLVISVGALTTDGEPFDWSSRGKVDALEIGEYEMISGTSVAAAHYSGFLARTWKHD